MSKPIIRRTQEQVDVLCRKYPLAFRIVTSSLLFVGGVLTEAFLGLKGLQKLYALIPTAIAGSAALIRESTGYRHAMGKTNGARKEVVYKLLELTALTLQAQRAAAGADPNSKLIRANVILPVPEKGTLKVWVHYNMTGDTDCELEFSSETGFAGHCMRFANGPLSFDRSQNTSDPRCLLLPPQAAAAVRPAMKAMLATPIYDPYVTNKMGNQRTKIGLLLLDSDLTVAEIGFDQDLPQNLAVRVADLLSHVVQE